MVLRGPLEVKTSKHAKHRKGYNMEGVLFDRFFFFSPTRRQSKYKIHSTRAEFPPPRPGARVHTSGQTRQTEQANATHTIQPTQVQGAGRPCDRHRVLADASNCGHVPRDNGSAKTFNKPGLQPLHAKQTLQPTKTVKITRCPCHHNTSARMPELTCT
jgi:hypothetical protein